MLYWPNAIVQDTSMKRDVYKIMTNDGYASYEEAKSMIDDWKKVVMVLKYYHHGSKFLKERK